MRNPTHTDAEALAQTALEAQSAVPGARPQHEFEEHTVRPHADPTLAEVVKLWLEDCRKRVDLASSTLVGYARVADHLSAWGQERPLGEIDMCEYVLVRRDLKAAPRTIALELRVAGVAFRWARARNLVRPSAELRIPRVKIDPNRFVLNHRTPTPSEAKQVIDAMPRDDWWLAVLLLARTGARVGEVVRLRGCDLDEPGGRIAFGATDGATKTGLRWFPLDEASLRALRGRSERGADPLLDFGDVTAPIQAVERRLMKACRSSNISRFTPHGLRRMVVGRLMRAKVDPATAATLTGHSIQVMLRYYRQVTEDDQRAAVEEARLGVLDDQ